MCALVALDTSVRTIYAQAAVSLYVPIMRQRGLATQPTRFGDKAACVHGVACGFTKSCFEQLEHASSRVLFYIS